MTESRDSETQQPERAPSAPEAAQEQASAEAPRPSGPSGGQAARPSYGERGPRSRYGGGGYGGDRGGGRGDRDDRRRGGFRPRRRKVCAFCVDKITHIDYKEHQRLHNFISDRGKILKSRQTGTCTKHQRALAEAIKRARQIALLPFVAE